MKGNYWKRKRETHKKKFSVIQQSVFFSREQHNPAARWGFVALFHSCVPCFLSFNVSVHNLYLNSFQI